MNGVTSDDGAWREKEEKGEMKQDKDKKRVMLKDGERERAAVIDGSSVYE